MVTSLYSLPAPPARSIVIIPLHYGKIMKLIAYTLTDELPDIRPAPAKRAWMDETPQAFAYRCLPLNIANSHGWEILSPCRFSAFWAGGVHKEAIVVKGDGDKRLWPVSHFGSGVLTFHVTALFRTEPNYNLWVGGPSNFFKDGIVPLSGLIETDWSPYSFTMNWRFTRERHVVEFEKGDPICMIFPVQRGLVEATEPEFRPLSDDPQTQKFYSEWQVAREKFIVDLNDPNSEAAAEKWQKAYYRGLLPNDKPGCPAHQTKLRVKEFKKPK